MCTVTFVPQERGFVFTSSRDEKIERPAAVFPSWQGDVVYSKDPLKGGTWFASNHEYSICLLNGGFENHVKQPAYRKSRGMVVLESINAQNPKTYIETENYEGIEPFTLIVVGHDKNIFFEMRWDGHTKHFKELDNTQHYIWSSATLYDADMRAEREAWFQAFLNSDTDMMHFHKTAGCGIPERDVLMKRDGGMQTVSITSVCVAEQTIIEQYDVLKELTKVVEL